MSSTLRVLGLMSGTSVDAIDAAVVDVTLPEPDHARPDHARPDHARPDHARPDLSPGTLSVVGSGGEACTPINFDPNVLSAGFSAGADPILRMRSPAYAISFGQRLSGQ